MIAIGAMLTKRLYVPLWLSFLCLALTGRAGEQFEVFDTGSHVYSNVTVTTKTRTHVFIQHSGGFAGIKLDELDNAALAKLGYKIAEPKPQRSSISLATSLKVPHQFEAFEPKITQTDESVSIEVNQQSFTVERNLLKGILACLAIAYVIFSHAATVICRKAGVSPGIGCWLPLVQCVFLLRAARMPAWWIVLAILPLTSLPLWIVWCVKICRVLGRGFLTVFFLLLPVTTPLAFLYLALAGERKEQCLAPNKVRLAFQDAV